MEVAVGETEEVVLIAGPLDGQVVVVGEDAEVLEFPMHKDGNVFGVIGSHPGAVMYCHARYIRSTKKPQRFLYETFFQSMEGQKEEK